MSTALAGFPIYFATKKYQRRKHHKKRINKKWQKKYGYCVYDLLPYGQTIMIDGKIYMTEKTFKDYFWEKKGIKNGY